MVYAPNVFTLQSRTANAVKEDGTTSEATIFSAFAAQDHSYSSSVVRKCYLNVKAKNSNPPCCFICIGNHQGCLFTCPNFHCY